MTKTQQAEATQEYHTLETTVEKIEHPTFEELETGLERRKEEVVSHKQLYRLILEVKELSEKQAKNIAIHAADAKTFRGEVNGKLSTLQASLATTNQVVMQILAKPA